MREFSEKYLDILKTDLAGLNLTRILESEEFYNKQILDSILPAEQSAVFKNHIQIADVIVDIGFGGGFPILPLAKIFPEKKFIGFEARGKKALAVTGIAEKLGIKNVKLLHQRYEDVLFDKKVVITFKAVSTIPALLSKIATNTQIAVFFYKGPNVFELEDINSTKKNWELIENCSISVPTVGNRTLLGFKNSNVLRGTDKGLVKISEIL